MALSLIDPKQLKRIRLQLGMTQIRIAKDAGVSQSLVAKIEAGTVDPTFSSLRAISEALRSHRVEREKRASDVMSSPVISVQVAARLSECVALMKKHGISQLPVLSGERSVGSVSENHILGILSETNDPAAVLSQPVRKLMKAPFPMVNGEAPIGALLSLFTYVPAVLVSSGEKIEGVIAKIDLLAAEVR